MLLKRYIFPALLCAACSATPALADATPHAERWDFTVTLDGKEIGSHSFTLSQAGKDWRLRSEAQFTATFVGIPVYTYRHKAEASWNGNCLATLTADTDDNGSLSHVEAKASQSGGRLTVISRKTGDAPVTSGWTGCLMDFAYWNPAMRKQTHLLNPQTGDIENVTITEQPPQTIAAQGRQVEARVWRVAGKHEPVDMLYAPDGEWVGLNATLEGGYALAYRLQ